MGKMPAIPRNTTRPRSGRAVKTVRKLINSEASLARLMRTIGATQSPPSEIRQAPPRRESVALCDLTDCLLEAYEYIERRAYEKFVERGSEPGRELEDWLSAERELLHPVALDVEESADYVRALVTAPGFTDAQIGVAIEPHWLAIIATREPADDLPPSHNAPGEDPVQVFAIHHLPAEVDPARATIVFANGILALRLPKVSRIS
jgi:HSP20 family molecular chaperone IbpA